MRGPPLAEHGDPVLDFGASPQMILNVSLHLSLSLNHVTSRKRRALEQSEDRA